MSISPTAERRPRRWLAYAIGALALLALCGLAAGAGAIYLLGQAGEADFLGTTMVDKLTREQVERAAGITLPAGARGLRSHYASFQNYILHARFEIDPAEAAAFLAGLPIADPLASSTERPGMYSDGMPEWWRPEEAQSFQAVSGQVALPSGYPEYLAVLVDTTDPANAIVYVVAFDT